MTRSTTILAILFVAVCCNISAHAQSSDSDFARAKERLSNALKEKGGGKQPRLRMFADRSGDLYWMDTHSIDADTSGRARVTIYIVKGGYPAERQQLTAACCGSILSTRVPEGTATFFRFDCSGSYTYTMNNSPALFAAPLSVAYNIAQFACAGARCKLTGAVCSE
jgi:hypothetical protein